MFTGRLPSCRSYQIVACDRVEIHGGSDEPVQGDGDIIGQLDVTIEVVPHAIHLVYPPGPATAAA
jgi:diacylglycerol kinase family enzyme